MIFMDNKPATSTKPLYLAIALYFCCQFVLLLTGILVRERKTNLAQFLNLAPHLVDYASYFSQFLLLCGVFYLTLLIQRLLNFFPPSREEREHCELRKRELAEEDAKAQAWLNSLD